MARTRARRFSQCPCCRYPRVSVHTERRTVVRVVPRKETWHAQGDTCVPDLDCTVAYAGWQPPSPCVLGSTAAAFVRFPLRALSLLRVGSGGGGGQWMRESAARNRIGRQANFFLVVLITGSNPFSLLAHVHITMACTEQLFNPSH